MSTLRNWAAMSSDSQELTTADVYSVPCPGAHKFLGTLRKGSVAPKSKKGQRVGQKQMQAKAFRLQCHKQGEVPRDWTLQEGPAEEGGSEARQTRWLWPTKQSIIKWQNRNSFCL